MITLWTIYDWPMTWSWVARRSVIAERDELVETADRGECLSYSSDLDALRHQFETMGLECCGRDPDDDESIIEVWLKRHNRPTTAKRMAS